MGWRYMAHLGVVAFCISTIHSVADLMGRTSSKSKILSGSCVETMMKKPEWIWLDPEQKTPDIVRPERRVIAPLFYWLAIPIFGFL